MGYEAREDARRDYNAEVAHEAFRNGDFDEEIVELILEGNFDYAVKERVGAIIESWAKIYHTKVGDFLVIDGTNIKVQRVPRPVPTEDSK